MKTFEDLNFELISDPYMHGKKCRMMFENGYGVGFNKRST